jgi:hypothetical protein
VGFQGLQKLEILQEVFRRLEGASHHKPRTHLVAYILEYKETVLAFTKAHGRRVQFAVVGLIGSFVPQKIPVGPGLEKGLVTLPASFPYGEGNGMIREFPPDSLQHREDPLVRKPRVFPSLKHKGLESQPVPHPAALEYLFQGEPIPFDLGITATDAAVIAVVLTIVGKFHQSPEIDLLPIIALPLLPGGGKQGLQVLGIIGGYEP